MIINLGNTNIRFKNEHEIYEHYVNINVKENEFNLTYNPTILEDPTDPLSNILAFATQDYFTPYVTTIGLYNDDNELLMVARLHQPISLSRLTNTNFLIKYDI